MPFDIDAARATIEKMARHQPADLLSRIEALARPRLTGTEGAEEVEAALRSRFSELGYEARELPFTFSTWPGRFGPTAAGVTLVITGVASAWLLLEDLPGAAFAALAVGLGLALLPLLLLPQALQRLPWGRVEADNLLFTRPGRRPSWLVMAHRDSKSQLAPSLVRTGAVVAGLAGWLGLLALVAFWYGGELFRFPTATVLAGAVLAGSGVVLAASWAGNASPGALDNASGLAALLAVAESNDGGEVGFLVTDGEELGLAGARAAAPSLPAVQGVINVDGLDDRGSTYVTEGYGWRREGSAPQLVAALLAAGRALEVDLSRRRLPRTLLVDHLPIAEAGVPAVTLLRGGWRSLLRVHTPGDTVERLTGRGAAESATLLAGALAILREAEREHLAGSRPDPS